MDLKHLFLASLLIFASTAKITDDQNENNLPESTTDGFKDKLEPADEPVNTTKPTCYHADVDTMCFNANKTGLSTCGCEQDPDDQLALICCNVTDINKTMACTASTISQYQSIHIINARQPEIDLSQLNNFKHFDSLIITDGNISRITGEFKRFTSFKCLNFSNNNITEMSERALHNLNQLQFLDLSSNNLTNFPTLPNKPLVDIRGNIKIPCSYIWNAINREINFLYKDISMCEVPTFYNWFNSTATVSILEYEKKSQIDEMCPQGCKCDPDNGVYIKLEGGQNQLILSSKVDCSNLGLTELPKMLPENLFFLNVSRNKITSLSPIVDNPIYGKLNSLFADNNLITSIEELDGSRFWDNFTQLSLKNNKIKTIPLYILSNLEKNFNGKLFYLGGNRIQCDCSTAKSERAWRFVQDYDKILCDEPDIRINELKEENVCKSGYHDWAQMLDYVILIEIILLVALISKVSYDWYVFKNSGFLPLPASWIILYNQK